MARLSRLSPVHSRNILSSAATAVRSVFYLVPTRRVEPSADAPASRSAMSPRYGLHSCLARENENLKRSTSWADPAIPSTKTKRRTFDLYDQQLDTDFYPPGDRTSHPGRIVVSPRATRFKNLRLCHLGKPPAYYRPIAGFTSRNRQFQIMDRKTLSTIRCIGAIPARVITRGKKGC